MDLFGYIDPGAGSLFIQSIIGIALAVSVAFRSYIAKAVFKVKSLFGRQSSKNE